MARRRRGSGARINPTSDARLICFRRFHNAFSLAVLQQLEEVQSALGNGKGKPFAFRAAVTATNDLPARIITKMQTLLMEPVPPPDHPDLPSDEDPRELALAMASVERDLVLALLEPFADPEFFKKVAPARYPDAMRDCETAARLWGMDAILANAKLRAQFKAVDQQRVRALAPKRARPDGPPATNAHLSHFLDYVTRKLKILRALIAGHPRRPVTPQLRRSADLKARRGLMKDHGVDPRTVRRWIADAEEELRKNPTVAEIVDRLGVSTETVTDADLELLRSSASKPDIKSVQT